jgi:hypothetical protein
LSRGNTEFSGQTVIQGESVQIREPGVEVLEAALAAVRERRRLVIAARLALNRGASAVLAA